MPKKIAFPPLEYARRDGLLARGGNLEPDTLITAYRSGIFPWYDEDTPILWWSPSPRCALFPDRFTIHKRSLRKIRASDFSFSYDQAFHAVISACAAPRKHEDGTWILPEIVEAYEKLHELGIAHSIEIWRQDELVGGLYGVCLGRIFFGESMFRKCDEASRAALLCLVSLARFLDFKLIDCQQESPHMMAMGATLLSRSRFIEIIDQACSMPCPKARFWNVYAPYMALQTGLPTKRP